MLSLLALFALSLQPDTPGRVTQGEDRPATAGPWVDCMRKVGREHYQRRASTGEHEEALDARCGALGEPIRRSHPNVFRLSREEAIETYEYCVRPGNGGGARCRGLRQAI